MLCFDPERKAGCPPGWVAPMCLCPAVTWREVGRSVSFRGVLSSQRAQISFFWVMVMQSVGCWLPPGLTLPIFMLASAELMQSPHSANSFGVALCKRCMGGVQAAIWDGSWELPGPQVSHPAPLQHTRDEKKAAGLSMPLFGWQGWGRKLVVGRKLGAEGRRAASS